MVGDCFNILWLSKVKASRPLLSPLSNNYQKLSSPPPPVSEKYQKSYNNPWPEKINIIHPFLPPMSEKSYIVDTWKSF